MTRHDVASHRRTARPRGGGDSRRSAIHRLYLRGPDAPRTAIVKRLKPRPADDPGGDDSLQLFISELSSLRFLSTLDSAGIAPRLYGDDPTAHLLVMLDLGERPSLADRLLASDDDATVDALAAYACAEVGDHAPLTSVCGSQYLRMCLSTVSRSTCCSRRSPTPAGAPWWSG